MTNSEFVEQIAEYVKKYAGMCGIKVHSPIIAQAILESGWGKSKLASKYHNYFGMKCGSSWRGKYTDMKTKEEYKKGTLTDIRAKFRAYDTLEQGIRGYFDFISAKRYANLKKANSAHEYIEMLKADGYATSSTYVDTVYNIWRINDLGKYDKGVATPVGVDGELESALKVIAENVIAGKFGNGDKRKENIYKAVQEQVNKLV